MKKFTNKLENFVGSIYLNKLIRSMCFFFLLFNVLLLFFHDFSPLTKPNEKVNKWLFEKSIAIFRGYTNRLIDFLLFFQFDLIASSNEGDDDDDDNYGSGTHLFA